MSHPSGEIHFPNGNRSRWVSASLEADPRELLQRLEIGRPGALILLVGGADMLETSLHARLQQLFSRGLAQAALETDALILDGGTQAGIMALMGQGLADRGYRLTLLGVAPAGRVAYPGTPAGSGEQETRFPLDPNHTHFVLVDSDTWGGETETLFRLAAVFADMVPVVVVLANGGSIAREELLLAVRKRWPIIILQGSGRLADELATLVQLPTPPLEDPLLAEIIADGDICLFPVEGSPGAFNRLLIRELRKDTVLALTWHRFAFYDANANRQQALFRRFQFWILVLGVASTLATLLKAQLVASELIRKDSGSDVFLRLLIVVLAAAVTALVAASTRFKSGSKWILLRAYAEAIKQEIFRYRCRSSRERSRLSGRAVCERRLASRLKSISRQLMQTEANVSALRSYLGPIPPAYALAPGDDGYSALTPGRYIRFRLDDQLGFYLRKIDQSDRRISTSQWVIIIAGSVGTVLAAMHWELWVALTTALVMAITSYLSTLQSESRLIHYHQAATELENIKAWWNALNIEEQEDSRNFEILVDSTEAALQSELKGWVQEMKENLEKMRTQHERPAQTRTRSEARSPA